MSKKHFIQLAQALANTRPEATDYVAMEQWQATADAITAVCAANNPHFDRTRFLAAATRVGASR